MAMRIEIARRREDRTTRLGQRTWRGFAAFAWLMLLSLALLARPSTAVAPSHFERRLHFMTAAFSSGDLLFRRGRSLVSRAVLAADGGSEYSHVGIASVADGRVWVIHSVPAEEPEERGGVIAEPVADFLAPDKASAAAIYRPFDHRAAITAENVAWGFARARVPFDASFDLHSAGELYCTELVWRAYRSAGLDLAPGAADGREKYLLPSRLMRSPDLQRIQEIREEDVHP